VSHLCGTVDFHEEGAEMCSDNPSGGDDQQETCEVESSQSALHPDWVCGFVDGEGCFSVAIHANPHVRKTRGWQIYPTFQVSQHRDNRDVLERLVGVFGVGRVRDKGPDSDVLVYTVYGVRNCLRHIVPFFEQHPLLVKRRDFSLFAQVVRALARKEHLTANGFDRVVRLAYAMNGRGRQRKRTLDEVLRGSSETVREARGSYVLLRDETVRAAWRHAEPGRNDLAAQRSRTSSAQRRVVTKLPKVAKFLVG
jgi:hypothetical protein